MKIFKNYLILYDAECPVCTLYSKTLVKTGLFEDKGRTPYQQLAPNACPMVDRQRAVNEIALVNQQTGEVTYGIEGVLKILGSIMPFFKPLFSFAPFVWLMSKVYAFLSYNRRVIIPSIGDVFQYQPTFRLGYRIAYLVISWAVTAYFLTRYADLLIGVIPAGNMYREALICGGQIFFQGIIVSLINKKEKWNYLGNMMTISFAGSLLLGVMLILSGLIGHHPLFYSLYFMLVAGLMFLEHIRRTKLLKLGWTLTITWALYRAALLIVIL
jgi:predicted DCC family thiol-disulfide oxidoreductase YuxK